MALPPSGGSLSDSCETVLMLFAIVLFMKVYLAEEGVLMEKFPIPADLLL